MSRRNFLRFAASAGTALAAFPSIAQSVEERRTETRFPVIMLFLAGGVGGKETFNPDPPGTPAEFRGPFSSISTKTGNRFCELFPKLAERSNRFALHRALAGEGAEHTAAIENTMLLHGRTVSQRAGEAAASSPVSYALLNTDSAWSCLWSAFRINESFAVPWDKSKHEFVPAIRPPTISYTKFSARGACVSIPTKSHLEELARAAARRSLLQSFNSSPAVGAQSARRMEYLQEQAFELQSGGGTLFDAFRLPERDMERYGSTMAGKGLLLARRMVERGVGAVTLYHEPSSDIWDAHEGLQKKMKEHCPEIDAAASALIDDISRGTLQAVFVLATEFNRTPKMNDRAGRDHWPEGNCVLMTGGHVQPGAVVGHTAPDGRIRDGGAQQKETLANTVITAAGGTVRGTVIRDMLR